MNADTPAAVVRQRFAERLQSEIAKRNWNQSELARRATRQLPEGEISRDNISNYIRQRALPSPAFLLAIAKALGTDPKSLLPERGIVAVRSDMPAPTLDIRDAGEPGMAFLRINRSMPWPVALEILTVLNKYLTDVDGR
jgi:transcriptional regulator with XRE-family HTH domain